MRQFAPEFCAARKLCMLSEDADCATVGYAGGKPDAEALRLLADAFAGKRVELEKMSEGAFMRRVAAIRPQKEVQGSLAFFPANLARLFPAMRSRLTGNYRKKKIFLTAGGNLPLAALTAPGWSVAEMNPLSPAVTAMNGMVTEALERGASDIHIEGDAGGAAVRMRIDGALYPVGRFEPDLSASVAARIKLMANLNTLETRKPQDGRFSVKTGGRRERDVRVSIVPGILGESIALRFLDGGIDTPSIEGLGLPDRYSKALEDIASLPGGLVIVCGPTGSGKTTTLAAVLASCSPDARKIITLEDPVEYRIPGAIQIPVQEQLGLGFDTLLRRVLRQDPDVIMVGEIRDGETAALAARAALTGHLVLTTVHASSCAGALSRLVELGADEGVLREVVRAVISQRLARRICPECRGAGAEHADAQANHAGAQAQLPGAQDWHDDARANHSGAQAGHAGMQAQQAGARANHADAQGQLAGERAGHAGEPAGSACAVCGGSGWKGRIALMETSGFGMPPGSLRDSGMVAAARGLTTGEEIARILGAEGGAE